jgi:oxygen-independent coproporphyrinogen-3 oxidase
MGGTIMPEQEEPYQERATYPLFFYPMFHPAKHKLSKSDVDSFCRRLEERVKVPTICEIYIHIPFCDSFCHMCACYKTHTPRDKKIMVDYVEMLKKEMDFYAQTPYVQSLDVECVYFGGGTPTTLPAALIEELVSYTKECFDLKPQTEINYEGEVRTLKDKERLNALKKAGCDRISFGVQTFDPNSRKLTGLVPTFHEIRECIENLRELGYKINFDLMFGLPGQSFDTWKDDLDTALELGAEGLDLYESVIYPTKNPVMTPNGY